MTDSRTAAQIEGDFVVFLIGMRVTRLHRPDQRVPVARAMGRMLPELFSNPDLGMLGSRGYRRGRTVELIQYWRSFEHLHAYARSRDAAHLPAWRAFNHTARATDAVGIWHETFLVPDGAYEAVYRGMPPYGLASATGRLGRGVERVDA